MLSARLGILLGIFAAAHLFMAVANGGECKDCKNCERQHGRFELGFNLDYESDGTATVVQCEFEISGELPPVEVAEPTLLPTCEIKSEQFKPYGIDAFDPGEPEHNTASFAAAEVSGGAVEADTDYYELFRDVSRNVLELCLESLLDRCSVHKYSSRVLTEREAELEGWDLPVASPDGSDQHQSSLPNGALCRVEVVRGEHKRVFEGRIRQLTQHWLVVETTLFREGRTESRIPILCSIPYINRHAYNVGIARWTTTTETWIPLESVLSVTVENAADRTLSRLGDDEEVGENLWRNQSSFMAMPAHLCANDHPDERMADALLPNTEPAEDAVEHVIGVNGADHFAEFGQRRSNLGCN